MSDFELQPEKMPDAKTNPESYFNNLFAAGSPAFQKLAYELQREFRSGGSPDINRIHIDRIRFDVNQGKGSFRVLLDIDFTFGCEDVRTNKPGQTSEWTFEADTVNHKLLFYSSPYERSTADEF